MFVPFSRKFSPGQTLPDPDPGRRLIAAITFYAVYDYFRPTKVVSREEYWSADLFVRGSVGQQLIAGLIGSHADRIERLLGEIAERMG